MTVAIGNGTYSTLHGVFKSKTVRRANKIITTSNKITVEEQNNSRASKII